MSYCKFTRWKIKFSVLCNVEWFSTLTIPLHMSRCWCCLVCQTAMWTIALTSMESSSLAHSLWPVTFIHAWSYSYSHGSTCTTKVQGRLFGEEVGHPAWTHVSRSWNSQMLHQRLHFKVTSCIYFSLYSVKLFNGVESETCLADRVWL